MNITKEVFDAAQSSKGGINRAQFEAIGVEWPPKAGWRKKDYTEAQIREFIAKRTPETPELPGFHALG